MLKSFWIMKRHSFLINVLENVHVLPPCIISWFLVYRQDDSSPDDEKRRNYGGVYVGIPADLSNVAPGQMPSTHKGEMKTLYVFAYYYHL